MNNAFLKSKRLLVTPLALAAFMSACGPSSPKQKVEAKLLTGRHAAGALPSADRGVSYGLTNMGGASGDLASHIVEAKAHPRGREVLWINFDSSSQPGIPEQELAAHALRLPETLNSLLQVSSADLIPIPQEITLSPSLKSIVFQRTYMGLYPVRDAYLEAVYWKGDNGLYTLRQINNNTHGTITVLGRAAPAVALEVLREQLPFDQAYLLESRQVVYPELLEPGIYQFVMATELTLGTSEKDLVYTITAENGTGRVLEAYSNRLHAAKPMVATVYKRNYREPTLIPKALPELEFTFGAQKAVSSIDGIADPGAETRASIVLRGLRFTIVDNTANAPMTISVPVNGSSPDYNLIEPDAAARNALNAYTTFMEINQFATQFIAKEKTPFLTYNLPVAINVTSSICNAFFAPSAGAPLGIVALGAPGQGGANGPLCANMAQVNDVAYHEWGHGLDNSVGVNVNVGGGISDGAFSEGIGDIISTYFTDSPQMAIGFFQANTNPIRSAENNTRYPASVTNQVHTDGLMISGAFWTMRKNLIAAHGKIKGSYIAGNLFFNHLLNTNNYVQSYQNVLLLDDNDGNPATKSPNHCAINAAFAKHGLATLEANCTDQPDPAKRDDTIVIATQKQETTGVTLMAATTIPETESMVACVGTRALCDKDQALPRATLMPEGLIGEKTAFSTTTPIPVKAQDIITLYAKNKAGTVTGSRMFKYVSK